MELVRYNNKMWCDVCHISKNRRHSKTPWEQHCKSTAHITKEMIQKMYYTEVWCEGCNVGFHDIDKWTSHIKSKIHISNNYDANVDVSSWRYRFAWNSLKGHVSVKSIKKIKSKGLQCAICKGPTKFHYVRLWHVHCSGKNHQRKAMEILGIN